MIIDYEQPIDRSTGSADIIFFLLQVRLNDWT